MDKITIDYKKREYHFYYDSFDDDDFYYEFVLKDEEMDSLLVSTIMELTDATLEHAKTYVKIAQQLGIRLDLIKQLEDDLLEACQEDVDAKYNEWLEENHERRLRECEEELAEQKRDYYGNLL